MSCVRRPDRPDPAEIAELLELQAALTDEEVATVRQWTARPAVLPWTELGTAALDEFLSRFASTAPTACCKRRCTMR